MVADSRGNDVSKVAVPITGFLGTAPAATVLPTPAAGGATGFTLPNTYVKAGLFTEDGGFNWTLEADGDPIVFFQEGYSIPSGLANVTCVAKLAQTDNIVRKLITGKTPDANGFITIDGGGHSTEFVVFTEEIFKNGTIRRRVGVAQVTGAVEDQSTRGEVLGYEVTFTFRRVAELNNEHLGEWLILPA